jgi:hypothetical protein
VVVIATLELEIVLYRRSSKKSLAQAGVRKKKRELLGGTYKLGEHTSISTAARVES